MKPVAQWRSRHAPSGRAVAFGALKSFGIKDLSELWPGVDVCLMSSGTSALACAIGQLLAELPSEYPRRVALPAYGCPSLVAAALWCGATPVYYDLAEDFSPVDDGVVRVLADECAVAVHVDAFGAAVGPADHPRLIRDLAQSFAMYAPGWQPSGCLTVVSTGRAKPMSLLRGGAVLSRTTTVHPKLAAEEVVSRSEFALRAGLYALTQRAAVLGVVLSIPRLAPTATGFSPLADVRRMPPQWSGVFSAGVVAAREQFSRWRDETNDMLMLAMESGACVPQVIDPGCNQLPLWRIPVLCPSIGAAAALAADGWHLGVSRLYGRTLPGIMGFHQDTVARRWPGASDIAQRLVTLPTHGRLSARQRRQLGQLLSQWCRSGRRSAVSA